MMKLQRTCALALHVLLGLLIYTNGTHAAHADGGALIAVHGGVGLDVDGDSATGEKDAWSVWTFSALYNPIGDTQFHSVGPLVGIGPTLRFDRLNGPRSRSLLLESTVGLDLWVIGFRQSISFGRAFVRDDADGWELLFSSIVRMPIIAAALVRFDVGPTWAGDETTLRLSLSLGIDLVASD